MINGKTVAVPAFCVVAVGVGAEKHAVGLERVVELFEHRRQDRRRHMKQSGIGKNPVEMLRRQIKRVKRLLPDLASAKGARHLDKLRRTFQADSDMPQLRQRLEIAAWATTEIQNPQLRLADQLTQKRCDILADIVVARALPKISARPL